MSSICVADIVVGRLDSTGATIETVYSKVGKTYAVYRTGERVVVQYADDDGEGRNQRRDLAALNVTKGEINGLIDGWRNSAIEEDKALARLFDRRIADVLTMALQGDQTNAPTLLCAIKTDVLTERTSRARSQYLLVAAAIACVTFLLSSVLSSGLIGIYEDYKPLWQAAGFGALGALFSIAISIRSREILTDLQSRDNAIDAVLRIFIGATAAAILWCLVSGKLVTLSLAGGTGALPPHDAKMIFAFQIVIAFVAGFSERLVSDLLTRTVGTLNSSSNPIAGGAAAPVAPKAAQVDGAKDDDAVG